MGVRPPLPQGFWLTLARMASLRRTSLSSKGENNQTQGWVG